MELYDLKGMHTLSGVEYIEDGIRFVLDGHTYQANEDPEDGYRSCLRDIALCDASVQFRFEPVNVLCRMDESDDDEILEFIDTGNGKTILRIGTADFSDYYPMCVMEWKPEKMAYNDGLKEGE